jgi:hypothetical protein
MPVTARAKGTDKRGIACRLLSTRLLLELSWQCSGAINDLAPSRPGFESSSGQVASEWDSCYRLGAIRVAAEPTLPNASLRYQVALDRRKVDKRRKPIPLLSAPFARAVM